MDLEQYFFADEGGDSLKEDPQLVNGYHINIYIKDGFIQKCKYMKFN